MKNQHLFSLFSFCALGISLMSSQVAYAGSGGAIGGNDGGSNLDSSTVTGATFEPTDAKIILEPLVNGITVNRQTNQIFVAPVLEADLALLTRQFNSDIQGEWVENLLQEPPPTFECLAIPDNLEDCQIAPISAEFADQLKTLLVVEEDSQQAQLIDQLVITLQGLSYTEEINPTQLDRAIKTYNKLVNSLDQEQLMAFSEMPEAQAIQSSLQQMREIFVVQVENQDS